MLRSSAALIVLTFALVACTTPIEETDPGQHGASANNQGGTDIYDDLGGCLALDGSLKLQCGDDLYCNTDEDCGEGGRCTALGECSYAPSCETGCLMVGNPFSQLAASDSVVCGQTERRTQCVGSAYGVRNEGGPGHDPVVADDFFCRIDVRDAVTCWGRPGPDWDSFATSRMASLDAGSNHVCGVTTDGRIECWSYYEETFRGYAITPPGGEFLQVDAGTRHTCALGIDHTIVCWGDNDEGACDAPGGEFMSVYAGSGFSCALDAEGAATCWGALSSAPSDVRFSTLSAAATDRPTPSACGVTLEGELRCWGDSPVIAMVEANPADGPFEAVTLSSSILCASRADAVVCWGLNDDGAISALMMEAL